MSSDFEIEISEKCEFWAETFFQMLLKFFLWVLWHHSRYVKGAPNITLYTGKKLGTYDTPNAKYGRKRKKDPKKKGSVGSTVDYSQLGLQYQNIDYYQLGLQYQNIDYSQLGLHYQNIRYSQLGLHYQNIGYSQLGSHSQLVRKKFKKKNKKTENQ